jgi:phytoene synthase
MDENFKYCAALVRDADRGRYLSTLFAPADRRDALYSLYAFEIEISRIRDLAREPMPGEIRLQWRREVLGGERAGEARANPVASSLLAMLARYGFAGRELAGLVEAHRFDLYDEPMPTLSVLQAYAASTAGAVFDFAVRILGGAAEVNAAAAAAGQAQTIANVIAWLPHHAARRQLFIPLDVLGQYGVDPEDIFAMRVTAELRAALAELRLRGRRHLAHIGDLGNDIPEKTWPAFLPLAPIRPWLSAMERTDYQPFRPPVVSQWRRQWSIWRAAKSLARIGR